MFEFILSFSPIVVLLINLLLFKMSAPKASALAFLVTLLEFVTIFKPGLIGIEITLKKGLAMGFFMGFIAFGAMMLYNLVDLSGGFAAINKFLLRHIEDRFVLFLMMCWVFSASLQGIAGYGIPAVIVSTVLIKAGYEPIKSVAAALAGHSWAISFGTMGSSIYAINLVTSSCLGGILHEMAAYGSLGMLCSGLGVCFIYGGFQFILKGLKYLIPSWIVMIVSLFVMANLEMVSLIGFVTGLAGTATMVLIYKSSEGNFAEQLDIEEKRKLINGILPYVSVITISIILAVLDPKIKLTLSFPSYETIQGVIVAEQEDYVVFNIFKYPFVIIFIATLLCVVYYRKINFLKKGCLNTVIKNTGKKIYATEIVLFLLLMTAQMMMDSGMIKTFSEALASFAGGYYPLIATMVGAIGTFVTGSNTNSNVLFGALQENIAMSLGLVPTFMCAAQSISASVAGAISPTTTALTIAAAGDGIKENEVYRYTITFTFFSVLLLGVMNLFVNIILS